MLSLASADAIDFEYVAEISSKTLSEFSLKAEEMGRIGDVMVNTLTSSNSTLETLGEAMKYVASLEQTATMMGTLHDVGIQSAMQARLFAE